MTNKEKALSEKFLLNRVTPILEPLMVDLLMEKPDDPVDYMIKYLSKLPNDEIDYSDELIEDEDDKATANQSDTSKKSFGQYIGKMVYRFLGKTGIRVSVLGFGNYLNNDKSTEEEEEITYQCIKLAIDNGINYFDTAELYGAGRAETAMGKAFKRLKVNRKDIVVSTKFFSCGNGVNDQMLSRKHLIEGVNASLQRLQFDYVDVIFAHRYDPITPIEEVCRAFNWVINKGKAFYWATSQWTPEQIMEAHNCCEELGLMKPIADQVEYNLMRRTNFEVSLTPLYEKLGYGTTIWSPLASGLLSGKYNDGKHSADSRLGGEKLAKPVQDMLMGWYTGEWGDQLYPKLKKIGEYAKELGYTQAQLSLAWCLVNTDVSTCLLGASKIEQLRENLKSLELAEKWTPEIEKRMEEIMGNAPTPDFNWRNWCPFEPRRQTALAYKSWLIIPTFTRFLLKCNLCRYWKRPLF